MFEFTGGTLEECNIPESAVTLLEKFLKEQRINIHGYMLLKGKKIISEKYFSHYKKDDIHRIYSITKTYIALAIGILLKKGMISLSDKICDYFPEKLPESGAYPWCGEMTIRDMLMMRTCFAQTTYKSYGGGDWTESYFMTKPDHICGTVFNYDTSAAHVLGALVEKLSGKRLMDFLRDEAFEKVGFSKNAYTICDPVGVSQGGSGMLCTMRDMAAVAYLANHYGVVDGEELIPMDFMREAVSNLTPTDLQTNLDEKFGYGYFTWMPRTNSENGFVMYGMGGQLAVCFPRYDFCYITIADVVGNAVGLKGIYDSFYYSVYQYLRDCRKDNPLAFVEEKTKKLTGIYYMDSMGEVQYIHNPCFDEEKCPVKETDFAGDYVFYDNDLGWKSLYFDFENSAVVFEYIDEAGVARKLNLTYASGSPKVCRPFSDNDYRCEVLCEFKMGHMFIHCYMIDEELGHVSFEFAWKDSERLSVRAVATNEPFYNTLKGFASAYLKKD